MFRQLVATLIAFYAIAFAFASLFAMRWPSLMIAGEVLGQGEPAMLLAGVDWRRLGIIYMAPYFMASVCLYLSAMALANKRRGAPAWYGLGLAAGLPCISLAGFEAGWWQNPGAAEQSLIGLVGVALLLGCAVWQMRRPPREPETVTAEPAPLQEIQPVIVHVPMPLPAEPEPKPRRRGPMPAAISRQRAMFAEQGRREMARRRRNYR